jgi:hypothetical protein
MQVMRKKRDLFGELMEGLDALTEQRTGKRTLRARTVKTKAEPTTAARELAKV